MSSLRVTPQAFQEEKICYNKGDRMPEYSADIQEKAKNLRVIDDELFRLVAGKQDVCQEILRTLLDDPDLTVVNVIPQYTIVSFTREITLDALCRGSDGRYFNVEMQKGDQNDDIRRTRFHASAITAAKTPKGSEFRDVPDVTVLYITEYDVLSNHQTLTISKRCSLEHGAYKPVDDGEVIVYANTAVKDDTPHTELLQLLLRKDSFKNTRFKALSDAVKYYKDTKEGREIVCKSIEEYGNSREEKGRLSMLAELVKEGLLSLTKAAQKASMSPEEFKKKMSIQ